MIHRVESFHRVVACFLMAALLGGSSGCGERSETTLWSMDSDTLDSIRSLTADGPRPDLHGIAMLSGGSVLAAVGDRGTILLSTDSGATWQAAHASGLRENLRDVVADGSDGFVAVGDAGTIVWSIDSGRSWAVAPDDATARRTLLSVVEVPTSGLVAVGENGTVVRSTDRGRTWTRAKSTAATKTLRSVAVDSSGVLVAVGNGGEIVRSLNGGVDWLSVAGAATENAFLHVTPDAQGMFVAVGENGEIRHSNLHGAQWTKGIQEGDDPEAPTSFGRSIVIPGNGLLAMGDSADVMRSADGVHWSAVTTPGDENSYFETDELRDAVAVDANVVVLVGEDGTIRRSENGGARWARASAFAGDATLERIAMLPSGVLIAIGEHGAVLRSVDAGISWSAAATSGTSGNLADVAATPDGSILAVGAYGAILRSEDAAVSWRTVSNEVERRGLNRLVVAPSDGRALAVGDRGAIMKSDDNGRHWLAKACPVKANLLDAARGDADRVVAVGDSGSIVYSEDGGDHWFSANTDSKTGLRRVATVDGSTMVSTGDNGAIVRSTDGGRSWASVQHAAFKGGLFAVIRTTKGTLLAAGSDDLILRSGDSGATWSGRAVAKQGKLLQSMTEGRHGALVGVGAEGTVVRSTDDGQTWTASYLENKPNLSSVIAEPDGALAVAGASGVVFRSLDDGATWFSVKDPENQAFLSRLTMAPHSNLVGVGFSGAIVHSAAPTRAPVIKRITHLYTAAGDPALRLELRDPDERCGGAKCIKLDARNEVDDRSNFAPHLLPIATTMTGSAESPEIKVQPGLLNVASPQPVYVRLRLELPNYAFVYSAPGGHYFEVPNHPDPLVQRTWFQTVAAAALACIGLYAMLLARPLWLLGLAVRPAAVDAAPKAKIPGLDDMVVGLLRSLLLPILSRHPRVMDAWVRRHSDALNRLFDVGAQGASDSGAPYVALPVDAPPNNILVPTPASFARFFEGRRSVVQIVAPGGAGKTRLALEVGRWVRAGLMTTHPAAALFVDEEFTDLLAVVMAKVQIALPDDTPPPEFVRALLARGRLWIFLDRLSERQKPTKDAVFGMFRNVAPAALVVTARYPIPVDGIEPVLLRPRMLDSTTLLSFLGEQLLAAKATGLFPKLGDHGMLVQRFARQITVKNRELPITPLLVRVFVAQAVKLARDRGVAALEDLPSNVPEAYFTYVEQLDATRRSPEGLPGDQPEFARSAAAIVARVELGDDFRPKAVPVSAVEAALRADARLALSTTDYLRRMEENGLLVRRVFGDLATVEFVLDPIAESLGAFEQARQCGSDAMLWGALIQRVAAMKENSKGFLLALRMNHAAYAETLGFPAVEFPSD